MKASMANESNNSEWRNTYENIKSTYDYAYKTIEEAISLEENEKPMEAFETYKRGIDIIDEALSIRVLCPSGPDKTWDEACKMINKLKRTRAEVVSRIDCLKSKRSNDFVPVTSRDGKLSTNIAPQTYIELANALENLKFCTSNTTSTIIYTHNNIKMYCIQPDGVVSLLSQSQTLTFFLIETGKVSHIFLQVGNWIYPLIPGVSPCYRTSPNCFIFPDIHSETEGASIGIVAEADNIIYELLTNILHGVVVEHEPQATLSEKLSNNIVKGAEFIAQGLVFGAEGLGNLLNYGTPKLIDSMAPASTVTTISPTVSTCVKFTEDATSKTAQVTGFVADKVALATSKLGQYLAPHIQKRGTQLLKTSMNCSEEEASSKVKNVLDVAAGAVEGFSTVYRGLEASAAILGQNLKNNTVKIVHHKYGAPAGDVATDTLNTVGNVLVISQNTKILTPKGLVKRTAKDTGKAVVMDYCHRSDTQIRDETSANYPK